ncbi:MAG: hypothetical protein J6A21_06405 [Lentisphaeria bacterium]|nr:hypothetical protein [Lentisphaeria bacterium]
MGEDRDKLAENFSQGVWILFRGQLETFLKSMITLRKQKEFLEKVQMEMYNRFRDSERKLKSDVSPDEVFEKVEAKRLFDARQLAELRKKENKLITILSRLNKLYAILIELEEYYKTMKALEAGGSFAVQIYRQMKEQQKETVNADAKQMIELMKKAKVSMNKVVSLSTSSFANNIPIVSDLIRFYGQFFIATDKIFDKVGSYAERIIEETEKITPAMINAIMNRDIYYERMTSTKTQKKTHQNRQ